MGTRECINIFMAAQPCNTANGYWGLHQYLHGYSALSHCKWALGFTSIFFFYGYSALSHCKWELGSASISSWLLSPVTLQMGTGVCIIFFFFLWLLSPVTLQMGTGVYINFFFLWLLSPVTLQMGTRECINIFMAAQPCNTANGYWGLHQCLHGYSALSHSKWVLGIV